MKSGVHACLSRRRSRVRIPSSPLKGQIAQSVEHLSEKQGVGSSILPLATMYKYINYLKTHIRIVFESHNQILKTNEKKYLNNILTKYPKSLLNYGFKVYSQGNEDGLLEEIFNRLSIQNPNFIEIGSGNGTENNTHYLLLKGSRGIWVDSNKKNVRYINKNLKSFLKEERLKVVNTIINDDNLSDLITNSQDFLDSETIDLFSVDIDGNDYYILKALLNTELLPKVIVTEYNSKFPPNLDYIPNFNKSNWKNDDYMGASLLSIQKLLSDKYFLVVCTHTGVNAFFVLNEYKKLFSKLTLNELWQPPNYEFNNIKLGHTSTLKNLNNFKT